MPLELVAVAGEAAQGSTRVRGSVRGRVGGRVRGRVRVRVRVRAWG